MTMTFEEAKRRFPHRFTMEHAPGWAKEMAANGAYYAPQYRTDQEWFDNTDFDNGLGLSRTSLGFCASTNQSWPLGKWLDRPFAVGDVRVVPKGVA